MENSKVFVQLEDHGLIDYQKMWDYQGKCHQEIVQAKRNGEDTSKMSKLLFCRHPHVYTLGKSGKEDHLIIGEDEREKQGISYYKINRGGDITYHGPGQLVVYPIFDLELFYRDIHKYIRSLEQIVINTLAEWGIEATRIEKYTGVWIKKEKEEKICAIGVHMSRWVSMHGFALNVNTDLNMFKNIIPCGIKDDDKVVCSMQSLKQQEIDIFKVQGYIAKQFEIIFRYAYI